MGAASSDADHEFCHPEMHEGMKAMHQKMMNGGNMPSGNPNKMPMNSQGHTH
jgi:hypothetical protein